MSVLYSELHTIDREVLSRLHPRVVKLLEKRGFTSLTCIQRLAIPKVLEGKNVLIIAPTGSGKTEAAVLPVLSKLCDLQDRGLLEQGIHALYITPLRALNRDLLERLRWWCTNLKLKIDVRHGDTDIRERARQSRDPPHILITTPEMLQAILLGRRLREHLRKLKFIIVDEVHELVEDKRGVQLTIALERIKTLTLQRPQVIGLSATVGEPEKVAAFLTGDEPCEIVQVSHVREMILDVVYPEVKDSDREIAAKTFTTPEIAAKLRYVYELIDRSGPAIVFVNTRSMAENLGARFHAWQPEYPIAVHHSSLSKTVRENIEQMLREGKLKAVIATSSLELGIDIGHINIVIQYTSPHQVTRLVQRVGRSGHRLDKVPRGVIIVHDLYDALEAIAIVKRAKQGYLESVKVPDKPYDVLCNQIVACILEKPKWKIEELYELIRKAYPYRKLTLNEFLRVVEYMSKELYPPLVYYDADSKTVARPIRKKSRREVYIYFFNNLSMIPEEKQYLVIHYKTGEVIGVLDEAFVAEYATLGTKFVFRGKVWEIVDIIRDKILVEEATDPIGAIPAWIGEEIPVPHEIAQDVGKYLEHIAELLSELNNKEAVIDKLEELFKVSRSTLKYIVEKVDSHIRRGYPVPSHKRIIIERTRQILIIHATFGTLVNRTLSKLISEYLSEKYGISIREHADPYAIMIEPSTELTASEIRQALLELSSLTPEVIKSMLVNAIVRSGSFKRRFIHVARRFNAIPKDADLGSISLNAILEAFRHTPVFDEALRECLDRDYDLETTLKVLSEIREHRIEIVTLETDEPSPITGEVLERLSGKIELTGPEGYKVLSELSFRSRILNEILTLVCLECLNVWSSSVKDLPDSISCPKCGSRRIGIVKLGEEKVRRLIDDLKRSASRIEILDLKRSLERTSQLVEKYGKLAAYLLCTKLSLDEIEAIIDIVARRIERGVDLMKELFELEREILRRRFL